MFKKVRGVLVSVATLSALVLPMSAHAALSAADQTTILSGISGSDTTFYAIGGGILVVLAGIWGFKKVQGLLGGK